MKYGVATIAPPTLICPQGRFRLSAKFLRKSLSTISKSSTSSIHYSWRFATVLGPMDMLSTPPKKFSYGCWLVASLNNFVQFGEFWWVRRISLNLVNLEHFVKSSWTLLKLTGSYKIVKKNWSEVLINFFEVMIKIDLHVFLPYYQISYDRINKYPICHIIFTEPWLIFRI